jgi:sugar/nucleoside kinase (ribokinase family)
MGRAGRLLVCGGVLIDDLTFADGRTLDGVLGGAALYALAGAALWRDDAVLVSGAGRDAEQHILPWMNDAGLSAEALRLEGPHTPRNILVYRQDGARTETPMFGPEHFQRLQPSALDIANVLTDNGAAYVFRDVEPQFWSELGPAARSRQAILLWEISSDVCTAVHRPLVENAARYVDALSINLEETQGLFGAKARPELFDGLRSLGAPVTFLRCGAEGSFVITAQDVVHAPAIPAKIVDVTGAGNAYGGAALAGLALGADPIRAARMGAIAAQLTIAQHGPFAPRDPAVRAGAWAALGDARD